MFCGVRASSHINSSGGENRVPFVGRDPWRPPGTVCLLCSVRQQHAMLVPFTQRHRCTCACTIPSQPLDPEHIMALETLLRAIHRAARSPPAHKLGFAVFINKDIASEVADLLLNSRDNHEIAALCIRTLKVCDVRPSPKPTDHDANPNYSLSPPAYTCDHDLHHLIDVLFSSFGPGYHGAQHRWTGDCVPLPGPHPSRTLLFECAAGLPFAPSLLLIH